MNAPSAPGKAARTLKFESPRPDFGTPSEVATNAATELRSGRVLTINLAIAICELVTWRPIMFHAETK